MMPTQYNTYRYKGFKMGDVIDELLFDKTGGILTGNS